MKRFLAVSAMILAMAALSAKDKAEGLWKSVDDKSGKVTAVWEIFVKGDELRGKILAVADAPQDSLAADGKTLIVGNDWIFNMKKKSDGVWTGGNIIDPENGKKYGCVIKFNEKDSTLAMAGTIGPFKQYQYWIPATEADIKNLQK